MRVPLGAREYVIFVVGWTRSGRSRLIERDRHLGKRDIYVETQKWSQMTREARRARCVVRVGENKWLQDLSVVRRHK